MEIAHAALTPDGTKVAVTGRYGKGTLVRTLGGTEVTRFTSPSSVAASALAFSPDGKWLAMSGVGVGRISDGSLLRPLTTPNRQVWLSARVGFSPDGRWLAWQLDQSSTWASLSLIRPEADLPPGLEQANVTAFSFSPDGDKLAVASGAIVRLYCR